MNIQLKKRKKRSKKPKDTIQFAHRPLNPPSAYKSINNRSQIKPEPLKSQNFKNEKPKEIAANAVSMPVKSQNNSTTKQLK